MQQITIYLDADGVQKLAEGNTPYAWDFRVMMGHAESLHTGTHFLAEFYVELPGREKCIPLALAKLDLRMEEVKAIAAQELREIQVKKADLLALAAPAKDDYNDYA